MSSKKKETLLLWEKLLLLQGLTLKRSGKWLTTHLSYAIEHLPDKEELIYKVFKTCVLLIFMVKRSKLFKNKILSMLEYPLKNKWTIFLDKLNSLENQNTLSIYLFKILLQELTLKEKVLQPFWNPVYKITSEKLLLPTETDFVDSDSILSNPWLTEQEVKLPFLTIQKTKLVNKNLQKISYPSFMSSHVDKWEKEAMSTEKIKTITIKIFPTVKQKKHLEEFMNTSRYVYNKALEHIKKGHKVNFMTLRDLLVTQNTKKGYIEYDNLSKEINELKKLKNNDQQIKDKHKELRTLMKTFEYVKNPLIKDFELKTPKDIRANTIKSLCDAFTSAISNLKKGNIKFFNMKFKKKDKSYSMIELSSSSISMKNGDIKILPSIFRDDCILKISNKNKKKYKDLTIENNVDIVKKNGNFYIHILTVPKAKDKSTLNTICSIDPGLRTLATSYSINNNETIITNYIHRKDLLKKLNVKIDLLKNNKKYYRKNQYNKIELKQKNMIDSIHWNLINHLLENNDVIYFGDIKSHNIVKGNKNKTLNRSFNDMKFFVLKQRLKYKASLYKKKLFFVNEAYTTKTCSNCGIINNDVGSKEIFKCSCCHLTTGRDLNASKNIMMKGLLT